MGKKTLANKKRPRSSGPGSSSTVRPPPSLTDEHRRRFRTMAETKVFKANVVLDWEIIRHYGQTEKFREYLFDPAWERLFHIHEKTYRGVTLEVLSSFKIAFPNPLHGLQNEVSFSAFCKYYHIPMLQFCAYSGLYTDEEMQSDNFQQLISTWNQHSDMTRFWNSISTKAPYNSSASRGTQLKHVSMRILHWLLVHSINGRIHSTSVVSHPDLFAMYSMLTQTPVNVAVLLAFAIRHQTTSSIRGVFCGAYITTILKNMGIFPNTDPGDAVSISSSMTASAFIHWGIPQAVIPPASPAAPTTEGEEPQALSPRQLSREIQILKNQQSKILKRQKGLKHFMVSSFKAIADKLKVKLPDCFSSSGSDGSSARNDSAHGHASPTSGAANTSQAVDTGSADLEAEIENYQGERENEGAHEADDPEDDGTESLEHDDDDDDDDDDDAGTAAPVIQMDTDEEEDD